MSYDALLEPIRNWLIDQSLEDCDIVDLFDRTCMRMVSVGIPIERARLFWPTLHPLFQGETVEWQYGHGATLDQFEHREVETVEWQRSPLKFIIENDLDIFRRRLDGPDALLDFDLLVDLKEQGFTDYLLFGTVFTGSAFRVQSGGNNRGIMATFSTKAKNGFSEDQVLALQKIQRRLAVACKTTIQSRVTTNIVSTYLGQRSGTSVLDGQIRRGDGKQTRAIVWFSDMRNSTYLAETLEPEVYFDLLNAFFSATADSVVDNGGEVLDFIGDAVLAIFPFETDEELKKAAVSANQAIADAIQSAANLNKEREERGVETFDYGIAVNKGEVMFGNIGIPSRLTFSVISPTVNQASRIENITKKLQEQVLADASFARIIPEKWQSVGVHELNGISQATELFKYTG